jgi:hypothetical protein
VPEFQNEIEPDPVIADAPATLISAGPGATADEGQSTFGNTGEAGKRNC